MSFFTSLLAQLDEKKEQLRRLNACHNQLGNLQGEFVRKRVLIESPELTAKTWKGILANEFLLKRDEMTFEYNDIVYAQLALSHQTLTDRITEIQIEIETLQASIAAEKARLVRIARERKDAIG